MNNMSITNRPNNWNIQHDRYRPLLRDICRRVRSEIRSQRISIETYVDNLKEPNRTRCKKKKEEEDYLRYSMVDLLQYEMHLHQEISCMQHRQNIGDAMFSPLHERIPVWKHERDEENEDDIDKCTFKIFWEHFAQGGARYCSKSRSQYNLPFSSTKPQSWRLIEQFEQVKWSTQ